MQIPTYLPFYVKERLLELASHLNPVRRAPFIKSVVLRLEEMALEYPRTLLFAVAGLVIGRIVEAVTGIPAGLAGLVAGGLFGLFRDLQAEELDREVSRIVTEELAAHS